MKLKTIQHTFQQGDLLLRRLSKKPSGEQKLIAKGRCVLAHGESGHCHVIEDNDAELIQIGEKMLLTITKPLPVQHEEHKSRILSPGVWEIGRVQEYDYFSQMKRQVVD